MLWLESPSHSQFCMIWYWPRESYFNLQDWERMQWNGFRQIPKGSSKLSKQPSLYIPFRQLPKMKKDHCAQRRKVCTWLSRNYMKVDGCKPSSPVDLHVCGCPGWGQSCTSQSPWRGSGKWEEVKEAVKSVWLYPRSWIWNWMGTVEDHQKLEREETSLVFNFWFHFWFKIFLLKTIPEQWWQYFWVFQYFSVSS